ncbi:MAG: alpha-amylase family glycosyl hydrolase, partial [Bacteroidota bacterium]
MRKLILFLLSIILISTTTIAQQRVKKVLFQGFWWDYWNSNFPNKWSDYLTELTPRLKAIGIDAVWIPPAVKGSNTSNVGYNVFDHYDLGDKYQKGGTLNTRTRMGNKDELLRMIAVMHANGIEVINDVVLNHVNDAGTNNGTGGRDPQSPFSIANANG